MRRFLTGILFFLLAAGLARAVEESEAERVIVLANRDDPDSVRLADYYAARRGVPKTNIITLNLSLSESIGWHEFVLTLFDPLQDELFKRGWIDGIEMEARDSLGRRRYVMSGHKISYLVVCRGVPLKVLGEAGMPVLTTGLATNPAFRTHTAAVDSELALLAQSGTPTAAFVMNPLFNKDRPSSLELGQIVKVSRLDGPTVESVERLIDQAIAAEKTGLIGRSYVDIGGPHAEGDKWLEAAAKELEEVGFDGNVDRVKGTLPGWARFDAPALYFGWYASDANGPFVQPGFMFPPGAVALHIHSFSADTVRSPLRGWVGPLVARGVTATFGNVTEPYLEFTHEPQLVLKALARGDSLGDAAAYAMPVYSWQAIVIGDPLYRPFKVSLDEQWAQRDQVPPALLPYLVLRRMKQLDQQGKRDDAIWTGMEAQRTQPSMPVALGISALLEESGDRAGALKALGSVSGRWSFSMAEAPLAVLVAQRLKDNGQTGVALELWKKVLGMRSLSREVRIEWLKQGLVAARAGHDSFQALRWETELNALVPPIPLVGAGK